MTRLQALEWYMEQVADTFRHWFPENAARENECYIHNWQKNDAITDDWKNFLLDYNIILARLYASHGDRIEIPLASLETR